MKKIFILLLWVAFLMVSSVSVSGATTWTIGSQGDNWYNNVTFVNITTDENEYVILNGEADLDANSVMFLHMNEGSGTTTEDATTNNDDGALYGDTAWATGKFGKGLEFDGSGDYVESTNKSHLNSGAMSIVAWIYINGSFPAGTNQGEIVERGAHDNCGYWFEVANNGKLRWWENINGNSWACIGNTALQSNQWYHVALTRSTSGENIYINGSLDKSCGYVAGYWDDCTKNLSIGKGFNGTIDEVHYLNKELTVQQVADYYNNSYKLYGNITSVVKDATTVGQATDEWVNISFSGSMPAGSNVTIYWNYSDNNVDFSLETVRLENAQNDTNYTLGNQTQYGSFILELKAPNSSVEATPTIYNVSLYSGVGAGISLTVNSPENITYNNNNITISGATNDYANISYSLNGASNITLCNNCTSFLVWNDSTIEGSNNITVYAINYTNSPDIDSKTVYFTIDTTPPGNITNVDSTQGENWINLTWTNPTDADYNHTEIYRNGLWIANVSAPTEFYYDSLLNSSTTYNYILRPVDDVGNQDNYTYYINSTLADQTPPNIAVQSPLNKTYTKKWVWANVTLNEAGSWCGVSLNSTVNQTLSNTSMTTWYLNLSIPSEGSNNVIFYCNDTSDNMGSSATKWLTVNTSLTTEPKTVLIKSDYTKNNWAWSDANGTYDDMFFWWRTFLDTEKIPYVVKNDSEIENGDLVYGDTIKYPVVIAGEMQSVSLAEVTQLKDFVDKGGLLISNGKSFAYDTAGNEQSEFYLSDVLGITKQNDVVRESSTYPYVLHYFNFLNINHSLYEGISDLNELLVYSNGGWNVDNKDLIYAANVNASENPIVLMNVTESTKTNFNPMLVYNEHGDGSSLWNGWILKPMKHDPLDVYWGIILKNAIEKAFSDNNVPFAQIYYWKNPYHGAYTYLRMDWEDLWEGQHIVNNTINWLGDMGYNAITCIVSFEINDVYGERYIPWEDNEANTEINRALLLNAYQKGMTMCAHTDYHANLDQLSRSAAFDEINTSLYWVWNVTGVWADDFVAPNYAGIRNTSILALEDAGIYESGDMRIGLNPFILSVNATGDDDFLEIPITTLLTYDGRGIGNIDGAKDNATLKTIMDFYIRNSMLVNFYQHPKCDGCTALTQYYITYLKDKADLIEYSPDELRSWIIQRNDSIISDVSYNSTHFEITLQNEFEGLALKINTTRTVILKNGSTSIPYFNYTMVKDLLNETIYVVLDYDDNLNSTIIPANIDIKPGTINLKGKGKKVTAYIELSSSYDVGEINLSTIKLNDAISAKKKSKIGDHDLDGIPDLRVVFDRKKVIEMIEDLGLEFPADVELTVTGALNDGTRFEGSDTIGAI